MQPLFAPKPVPPGVQFGPGYGDYQLTRPVAWPNPHGGRRPQPWPPDAAPLYGNPALPWAPGGHASNQAFPNAWPQPFAGGFR
jgi:hypothetical protein